MKIVGTIVSFLSLIPAAIFSGFAFQKLWAWFIVPTFHMEPIGIPAALGIMIFASLFRSSKYEESDNEELFLYFLTRTATSIVGTALVLGLGFIVSKFM